MQKKRSMSAIKKGMNRDTHLSQQQNVEYSFMYNGNTNNETGQGLNIQNEPSNYLGVVFPENYKVIGFKNDILSNKTYYLLTNPTTKKSSVGFVENNFSDINNTDELEECPTCNKYNTLGEPLENQTQTPSLTYQELFNDDCLVDDGKEGLNFDINFPAKKIEIKQEKLGTFIYWNDGKNPPRYLNVSDISYLFIQEVPCDDDIEVSCPLIDKLLIFPKHNKLILDADSIQVGGNLKLGTYEFYACYCDLLGNELTQYSTPTNPISIFDENNNILSQTETDIFTNFAIKIKVNNLDDKNFKYYKVVCVERSNVSAQQTAFIEGIHPTTDNTIVYTHSGSSSSEFIARGNQSIKRRIDFNKLNIIKPHYDKAETTMVSGGRLWHKSLTKREEINLQPVVNLFGSLMEWQTVASKQDLYKSAIATSKYKGYSRDEVQSFGIRFFFKDGDYSAVFPIVGRPLLEGEDDVVEDINFQSVSSNTTSCISTERNKKWQIFNTAEVKDTCVPIGIGVEIEEPVKKVCTIENVFTIPSGSTTIEIDQDFTDLLSYIEDNPDEVITGITEYLEDEYPDSHCMPLFEGNCEDVELDNFVNSISTVTGETITKTEADFPENYQPLKSPEYCTVYRQDYASGEVELIDDDKFRYEFMYKSGNRVFYSVKERNYSFTNESCNFAEDLINVTSPSQTVGSYFHNYKGETDLADLQTTKTTVESLPEFTNKVHKGGLWYKGIVNQRDKFVLEISKLKEQGDKDDIIRSNFNPDKKVRLSLFNKCSSTTAFYSEIVELRNEGLQLKIEVNYEDEEVVINGGVPISVPDVFSNGSFLVAVDDPIYECQGVENWVSDGDEQTEPLINRYRTAPADGCYSIITRDIIYTNAVVSWDSITIDKTETYISTCTFNIPDVNNCEPQPYERGRFAYWESTEQYPDNNQLYNSSTLKIKPSDLALLSSDKIDDFINYYSVFNNILIGNSLTQGKYYLIDLKGSDNFSNIGGFIENTIFLCTVGGLPNTWLNVNTSVKEISVINGNIVLKPNTNLTCQNIRHPKMPDNTISPFIYDSGVIQKFADTIIFPLGVTLDSNVVNSMLKIALQNNLITQKEFDSIEGYEILRGDNTIHKSIVANGLAYDMYNYQKEDETWWYANFPFNDLGKDKYHTTDETREDLVPHPQDGESNYMFSFLSPDLFLTKPTLPTEVSLSGFQFGSSLQSFANVEDHPKYTILGSRARSLANTLAIAEVALETLIKAGEMTSRQWFTVGLSSGSSLGLVGTAIVTGAYVIQGFVKIGQYRYQWLETFRNLGSSYNLAYMGVGVGNYNRFLKTSENSEDYLRGLSIKKYLKDGLFNIVDENNASRVNINNWLREDSVLLSVGENYKFNYPTEYINFDNNQSNSNSSKVLSSEIDCKSNVNVTRDIASPYMTLKNYVPNQWGTVDSIKWLTTNSIFKLTDSTECTPVFGGTVYISPFSWRRKTPLFKSTSMGLPDKLPYKYSAENNIATPRFYVDYEIDTEYNSLVLPFPDIDSDYNLDCPTGTRKFYIKPPSKFYLYSYGIVNFLVESEINCHFRYAKKERKDWFYPQVSNIEDWVQEKNLSIKEPNTFYYNTTYSFPVSNTPYKFLDYTYDKEVWFKRNLQPNAVIYSEMDNNENDRTDPWLVYKPLNWYEFNTRFGKLIDLKDIESNQFFARFENQLVMHNAIDTLVERVTAETKEIGTAGIFASRPLEFKSTDLGFLGTQHVESCSTPYGHFMIDAKRGRIIQIDQNGKDVQIISEQVGNQPSNNAQWFRENLPFKILKYIPELDIDNKFKGIGLNMWWDDRFSRVFITKRDYVLKTGIDKADFTFNKETEQLFYQEEEVFFDDLNVFEDVSWTIAYKPTEGSWVSYYSFKPDYAPFHNGFFQVGYNWSSYAETLWNHPLNNSSFQVFQGQLEPFIVEYPTLNENVNKVLETIQLNIEARRYQNYWDYAVHKGIGFNRLNIGNATNNSGWLILNEQKRPQDQKNYPINNPDKTQEILYSSVEDKHNINYFFNRVINQDNNIPIRLWDKNRILNDINPLAISFTKKGIQERLRGESFYTTLVNDKESRFNIILKNSIQKEDLYE